MTVKKLKQMLKGLDDDLPVFIYQPSQIGGWLFAPACEAESGFTEFPPPEEETGEHGHTSAAFCLMPHGVTEHDEEQGEEEIIPEMN